MTLWLLNPFVEFFLMLGWALFAGITGFRLALRPGPAFDLSRIAHKRSSVASD